MTAHRVSLVVTALCGVVVLAGCGTGTADVAAQDSATTTAGFPVRIFPPGGSWTEPEQPVVLQVSNQSFDDPEVRLSARLDGLPLFDHDFAVEDQHTTTLVGVDVAPGRHTLTVVSDSGAEVEQAFELPAGERRWLVVHYWYLDPDREEESWGGEEDPGPSIHVVVSDEAVPMA